MARSQLETADRLPGAVHSITGAADDFACLLRRARHASYVLLGEATHGTHEFYSARAEITRRLITEQAFTAVVVEADWPDAYRVNRWVRGEGDDAGPEEALRDFQRFPRWMWRNAEVTGFLKWLREHNDSVDPGSRAGFYGMDLYSMHSSITKVLEYLEVVDPDSAVLARERYACFDHFGSDPQSYGYAASKAAVPPCERDVVQQLTELQRRASDYVLSDGRLPPDAQFFAEQNARLVRNAEAYYRSMFGGRESSWNLRDQHMAESLDALAAHLGRQGPAPRIVVWAHNSHLGDARATEMSARGELNLGQVMREKYARSVVLVGFTTYTGTVTAADDWGGAAKRMSVRPALPGSYEAVLHESDLPDFLLDFEASDELVRAFEGPRLERAIGVIYRPETERWSHYFHARMPQQYDFVIHYDRTTAVRPLDLTSGWEKSLDLPETWPSGM